MRVIPAFPVIRAERSGASVCRANCPAVSWKTVDFDVFWQVVTAGELLLTNWTLVGFDTWVWAPVSGQLVWPGKPKEKKKKKKQCFMIGKDKWGNLEVSSLTWTRVTNLMTLGSTWQNYCNTCSLTLTLTTTCDFTITFWIGMTSYLSKTQRLKLMFLKSVQGINFCVSWQWIYF